MNDEEIFDNSLFKRTNRAKWLREMDEQSHEMRRELYSVDHALYKKNMNSKKEDAEDDVDDAHHIELLRKINPYSTLRKQRKSNKRIIRKEIFVNSNEEKTTEKTSNEKLLESSSSEEDDNIVLNQSNSSVSSNEDQHKNSQARREQYNKIKPPSLLFISKKQIKDNKPKGKKSSNGKLTSSSSSNGNNTKKRKPASRKLTPKQKRHNGIEIFLKHYKNACEELKIDVVDEIIEALEFFIKTKESIYNLDLAYLSLSSKDLDSIALAFNKTYDEIKNIPISSMLEPRDLNLKSNIINDGASIVSLLKSISTVECLNITNIRLQVKPAIEFGKALNNYSNLKVLMICGNSIGSKGAIEILNALTKHNILEVIDLGENNLNESCSDAIVKLINVCPLKSLSLKYNKIGSKGMKKIIDAVHMSSTLEEIDFTFTGMGKLGKHFIGERASVHLKKLCLGLNQYQGNFGQYFADYLSKMKILEILDIRFLHVNVKSMCLIMKSIVSTCINKLKELVLSGNTIDSKTERELCKFISETKSLELLGLRGCGLSYHSIVNICTKVKDNNTIKTLDLSGNSIKHKQAVASLCDMARFNTTLKVLSIIACKIDRKSIGSFGLALQTNMKLKKVFIDGNPIGDKGIIEFSEVLTGNKTLKVLSIKSVKISSKGLMNMLNILNKNGCSIEIIDASDNHISSSSSVKIQSSTEIFVKM